MTKVPLAINDGRAWKRLRQAVSFVRKSPFAPSVPKERAWTKMTPDALWRAVVAQVAVAGGSGPWQRRAKRDWRRSGIRWPQARNILAAQGKAALARAAQRYFSEHGVRWVGKSRSPSLKAVAIAANALVLLDAGGPRRFFREVAKVQPEGARLRAVSKRFSYIKKKGSRDLLIELGLSTESIAVDARIATTLQRAGVLRRVPRATAEFEEVEELLKRWVARPLKMNGAQLDRLLYGRADLIKELVDVA